MGRAIEDREYQADDYDKFNHRIHDQLDTLADIKASKKKMGKAISLNEITVFLSLFFSEL